MKKSIAFIAAIVITVSIFIFFWFMGKYELTICLPFFDKVTIPNLKAFAEWMAGSAATISIIGNILQFLKIKAIRSPGTLDDQILTYLKNIWSFNWFKSVTEKKEE